MGADDLRIKKTHRALNEALHTLLKQRSFNKITVNDLCKEAQVSRAAFYAHFADKYDFLRFYLRCVKLNIKGAASYEAAAAEINSFVYENKHVIKHVFEDMEKETTGIVFCFLLNLLEVEVTDEGKTDTKEIVLTNLLIGGIISYVGWHVENRFPPEQELCNRYFYDILRLLSEWYYLTASG